SARELHQRLGRFVAPLAKTGRQLDSAVSAYNEAIASFDTRVMPQLRRIEQAGAGSERELDAPEPLEITARAIASQAELARLAEDEPAQRSLADEAQQLGTPRRISG
ncbi:MAG TPA: DNA recombination protein RmuC, partial [Solirubrobacteraceae bacterium]